MSRMRRPIQVLCLALFLMLLVLVSVAGAPVVLPDLFLQMDPSLMLVSAVAGRVP